MNIKNKLPRSKPCTSSVRGKLARYSGTSPEKFVFLLPSSRPAPDGAGRFSASRNKRSKTKDLFKFWLGLIFVLIIAWLSIGGGVKEVFAQFASFQSARQTPLYAANQVMVKYKAKSSPYYLEKQIEERRAREGTVAGRWLNLAEDVSLRVSGQGNYKQRLVRIQSQNNLLGVIDADPLFKESNFDPDRQNLLYKIDGGKSVAEAVESFASFPEVEFAKPNYIKKITRMIPNDPRYTSQWALDKMKLPDVWEIARGSREVVVALIDTGVDYNHEDLRDRQFIESRDYVTCEKFATASCIPDPADSACCQGYTKPVDTDPRDEMWHGTHLAGIVGAMVNNNKGVSGLNWEIKLMPVRILNSEGEGEDSWILEGIAYAINYAASHGVRMVMNLSLGSGEPLECTDDYRDILELAKSAGVVVAIAAGNSAGGGRDASLFSPANCQKGIVVAATNAVDTRAVYSNYGGGIDLAAPGGEVQGSECTENTCILSTVPSSLGGGSYGSAAGTSMATAQVSGAAALILAVNPGLTPAQVEQILKGNTDAISMESGKPVGTGRLNVYKALLAVEGAVTATPAPTAASTPTTTPTSPPVCQPTPQAGYKVILKAPKNSVCVYSEYRTDDNFRNACLIRKEERGCN